MARPSTNAVLLMSGAFLLVVAAFAFRNWSRPLADHANPRVSDARLRELRLRSERDSTAADAAVEAYHSHVPGRLDDVSIPAEDILRGLPGVLEVERLVAPAKPSRRIVHLRDLHFVPRDLFALDVRQATGRPLSETEVDRLYEQHLLETDLVQIEQMVLLRCLARHHRLHSIHIEGLTAEKEPLFRQQVAALKGLEEKQIKDARVQLREVRCLMQAMEAAGKTNTDRYDTAASIEKELLDLLDQHRPQLLEVGAAGRLLLAGEIGAVLALDDGPLLDLAKPVTPDGRVKFDSSKVRQREDAQVKAAINAGPFALIVLGGAHDLSDSIRRVAGADCEYVRVTTKAYKEFGP